MLKIKANILREAIYRINSAIFFLLIASQMSCKKLVETPLPIDQVGDNAVYTTDPTAIAVFNALYTQMNNSPIQSGAGGSISLFAGLAADEFNLNAAATSGRYLDYYQNNLKQTDLSSASGNEHWAPLYNFIFICNAAITGLNKSSQLTPLVKPRLLGEAKLLRALFYFYLINEFGDVPLILTTDPQINAQISRTPKAQVYEQIIADLKEAEANLSSNYLDGTLLNNTSERVRPSKWAAMALLARVYLYSGDYARAEEKATAVINNSSLFNLITLNEVFLKNSKEAIWQLQPTDLDLNTKEAYALIIPVAGPNGFDNPVRLSNFLLNSFEPGDLRAVNGNWINTTIYPISPTTSDTVIYPFKYKIDVSPGVASIAALKEYFMVLRLGEQFLIRAEARAQLGNIDGAKADLNAIRNRAGLGDATITDKTDLLEAILHERQVELFSEWGHRWFDLKRTGNIDTVMSTVTPIKANGSIWQSFQQLFPISLSDLISNPKLKQNPGY